VEPVGVFTEMGWRVDKPLPERGLQAEGVLAVEDPGGGARAWYSADAPSIRVVDGVVSADGPVEELAAGSLGDALAQVGDRLSPGRPRASRLAGARGTATSSTSRKPTSPPRPRPSCRSRSLARAWMNGASG